MKVRTFWQVCFVMRDFAIVQGSRKRPYREMRIDLFGENIGAERGELYIFKLSVDDRSRRRREI